MHHTHSTSVGTGPDKSLSLTEQNLKSLSGVNLKRDKDLKIEILDANQLATSKTQKGKEPSNIIEEVPLNTGKFWRQVKDDFTDTFLKMKQEFAIKKQQLNAERAQELKNFLDTRLEHEAKQKIQKCELPIDCGTIIAKAEAYYCTSEGKVYGEL